MQTNEWAVPFVSHLKSGQNAFTVEVPLHFCYNTLTGVPNKMYFSKLDLVPDFFSIQAEELDLDSANEENMEVDFKISISAMYGNKYMDPELPLAKRPVFKFLSTDKPNNVNAILDFLSTNYFAKQSFQKYPPFFWDWFDVGMDEHQTPEEFIKDKIFNPAVEGFFYSTRNELLTTHWRQNFATQDNYKSFPNGIINPFVFPKQKANIVKTIRIRLFLQPKTSVIFSNAGILSMLGFDVENNELIKTIGRQFAIINNSATTWLEVIGDESPSWTHWELDNGRFAAQDTKVQLKTSEPFAVARAQSHTETCQYTATMPNSQLTNSAESKLILSNIVDRLTNECNLNVVYNLENGIVYVPNPLDSNDMLKSCFLSFPSVDIANLFNYNQMVIEHDTPQQIATSETITSNLNFDLKAKSLVFDTNLVYVIALDTISSDRMHPLAPGFVASLHPVDGTMKMDVPLSRQPDFFRLAEYQTGQNQVQLHFDLFTILPNKQHVKLNWKPGATVCGILRATF